MTVEAADDVPVERKSFLHGIKDLLWRELASELPPRPKLPTYKKDVLRLSRERFEEAHLARYAHSARMVSAGLGDERDFALPLAVLYRNAIRLDVQEDLVMSRFGAALAIIVTVGLYGWPLLLGVERKSWLIGSGAFVVGFVSICIFWLATRYDRTRGYVAVLIIGLAALAFGIDRRGTGAIIATSAAWIVVIAMMVFALAYSVDRMQHRYRMVHNPGLFVAAQLLTCTETLLDGEMFREPSVRQDLIDALYSAALIADKEIPGTLSGLRPDYRAIVADRCAQTARLIRSFSVWVALPRSDTRMMLSDRLDMITSILLRGNYDDLPLAPEQPSSARLRLRDIGGYAAVLITGVLPIGGVLAAEQLGIHVSGTWGTAIIIAVIGWAILTYVSAFDSHAVDRIGVLKDVASVLVQLRSGK
jgi:hypothetical protein